MNPEQRAALDALAPWRAAGVLSAGDVQVAATVARLAGEADPRVLLAVALAVRAPRFGHVCVDLERVATTIVADPGDNPGDNAGELVWPEAESWLAAVAASPLATAHEPAVVVRGSLVYLGRYHQYEADVAARLLHLAAQSVGSIEPAPAVLSDVFSRLLTGEGADAQRAAVAAALHSGLTVLVGGPGTGKTTTVAALLAVLVETGGTTRLALAAPTGKAAARLTESFRQAAHQLPPQTADMLASAEASTVHRLLGVLPGSVSRFRHNRDNPLPHDVVIVDETSMVSLPLMAKLLDAVRPGARLVLVGDPAQLASVEAGSVLADVVGPVVDPVVASAGPLHTSVSVLTHSRRFPPGSPVDAFATAVRRGDSNAAIEVLAAAAVAPAAGGGGALAWLRQSADSASAIAAIRAAVLPTALITTERAAAGDAVGALASFGQVRVLCAHRHGPFGVSRWNARIEQWLSASTGQLTDEWYAGRPVLVTANDYQLGLFNGDIGIVVTVDGQPQVAFPDADGVRYIAPSRLESFETVHAMTIHKSQGSEFDHVVVLMPPAGSNLSTRELLYTAVTRARIQATLVGDEPSLVAAVDRRVERASGLGVVLWPDAG